VASLSLKYSVYEGSILMPDIIELSYPRVALDRHDESSSNTATSLEDLGVQGPGVKSIATISSQ